MTRSLLLVVSEDLGPPPAAVTDVIWDMGEILDVNRAWVFVVLVLVLVGLIVVVLFLLLLFTLGVDRLRPSLLTFMPIL